LQDEEKARKERMKDYRRRYRESHGIKEHKRPWKKILAGVAVLCVVGGGTFFAAQTKAASLVSIDGQEAANLTEDDINAYLDEREGELGKKTLALQADGVNETLALEKLDGHFDRERIMDEALLVGRTGTPWQRVADVVQTLRFGKDVPLSIAVDDEKLTQAIGEIHDSYNAEPQDAYASPTGKGGVEIHKEKAQITIDADALKQRVVDELHQGSTAAVAVPVTARTEAKVKEADLKDIDTVLTYYTTHFDGVNGNRDENINIAQKLLNHTLVAAGKDCSFNDTIGTRTRDKGYKDAPVYFDNKVVLDAGGGVCQVSTTLFNAALRSGMIIASRSPHYAPAGYVPVGMDATVADNSLDFAFTNPFKHPVYICTEMNQGSLTVYILGNHADTCNVSFATVSQKTLPHRVIHRHDDSVTEDKRDQEGYDGHDITIRRTVAYADGDHYTDTIVSHYDPNSEIILTPGPSSEETVQTTNLDGEQPQDAMLNAPHDPTQIPEAPAEEAVSPSAAGDADAGESE
jgi:vancomycin resistance protein YoaR